MPESVKQRFAAIPTQMSMRQMQAMLTAIQADLEQIRVQLNTHVHGGVTTGASNTAVPTTTIAQTSLNLQP